MASITNKPEGLELSIVKPLRGSRNNAGDLQA